MKPLSIADYLDHLGRAAGEKAPPPRESSPFRPRSLPSPQNGGAGSKPVFDRIANAGGVAKRKAKRLPDARHGRQSRFCSSPRRGNRRRRASRSSPRTCRSNSPRLTRAAARKVSPRGASRLRTATRLNSPLRGSRRKRSSRSSVSTNTRSSKARSGPASSRSRTMSAAPSPASSRRFSRSRSSSAAVDELAKAIARLCAGNSPGLIKIRGPERVLALLRQRIADLPIEVEYVEDDGVETVVEANATQIVAELRPWAELLASFEA